jgi:cysteine-rich repeat protein
MEINKYTKCQEGKMGGFRRNKLNCNRVSPRYFSAILVVFLALVMLPSALGAITYENFNFYALNSSKGIIGGTTSFNTSQLEEIEYMNISFTVNADSGIVGDITLRYTADGIGACAPGNKQHDLCYNFDNSTYQWIEFKNGTETTTFKDEGNAGDFIVCDYVANGGDTQRNYTCQIDEHYNPNVFKHYEAEYNFSDVKWQTGTNERITKDNYARVCLNEDINNIPLDADQYKLDFRVNFTGVLTEPLQAYLCNTSYAVSGVGQGDPSLYTGCALVAQKLPADFQDDGTKFRGVFTKQLIDQIGDIGGIVLKTDEPNPTRSYNIKTYGITNPSYNGCLRWSIDAGDTWINNTDGYETEANINWFYDGGDPTTTIFMIEASNSSTSLNSSTYNMTWDIDPSQNYAPLIDIQSPTPETYIEGVININWSVNDPNDDNFTTNVTATNGTDTVNILIDADKTVATTTWNTSTVADGNWSITVESCENETTDLFCNSDTHLVYVDNTNPVVFQTSPVDNANYTDGTVIAFSGNASDEIGLDTCEFYNDITGSFILTASTPLNGATYSPLNWAETFVPNGAFTWAIKCNDTSGKETWTANRTFTVDNVYPTFSNYADDNGTLIQDGTGTFNVTLTNTNGTVLLEINGENVTATPTTLWTPEDMTTTAWYDAADASTLWADTGGSTPATTTVARWDDKSGNDYEMIQTNGAFRPLTNAVTLNGKNVLNFTGDGFSGNDGALPKINGSNSFYFVTRMESTVQSFYATQNGYDQVRVGFSDMRYQVKNATLAATVSSGVSINKGDGNYYVWTIEKDNIAKEIYFSRDGGNASNTAAFTIDTLASSGPAPVLGHYFGTNWFTGAMAEVIIINDTTDNATREKIEGYLAWKWNTTESLPADHPYKTAPPTKLDGNYTATYTFTQEGDYNYTWHSWGNGLLENHNESAQQTYTVNAPVCGDGAIDAYQIFSLTESFESPAAPTTYADNLLVPTGWIGAQNGPFGWNRRGMWNVSLDNSINTSFGDQIYRLEYNSNAMLVTSEALIPYYVQEGDVYNLSFYSANSSSVLLDDYYGYIVAWAEGADRDLSNPKEGTILQSLVGDGVVNTNDMSYFVSGGHTVPASPAYEGYNIGLRFLGPGSTYDNVQFSITRTEACDDGNLINGDGCSSTCEVETDPTIELISPENNSYTSDTSINFTANATQGTHNLSNSTLYVYGDVDVTEYCFQESFNVDNQTGVDGDCGVYTGGYSYTGVFTNEANAFDGNYGTSATLSSSPTTVYINYTIPANTKSAKWLTNNGGLDVNLTVLSSCLTYDGQTLQLRWQGGGRGTTTKSCYDGTWNTLASDGVVTVFEEAIYWEIVTGSTTGIVNQTTTDLGGVSNTIFGTVVDLVDGIYTWFYDVFGYYGRNSISGNNTLTIDSTNPVVTIVHPVNNVNETLPDVDLNWTLTELNNDNCTFNIDSQGDVLFGSQCYQESFNVSDQQGTDGDCYISTNGAASWTGTLSNSANAFDGDDSTAATLSSAPTTIYINYTIPIGTSSAIWSTNRLGPPPGGAWTNLTVLSSCLTYEENNLQLRWQGGGRGSTIFSCYDGTWQTLLSTSGLSVYEEAMYWNITNEPNNFTMYNMADGPHNASITCTDVLGQSGTSGLINFSVVTIPYITAVYPMSNIDLSAGTSVPVNVLFNVTDAQGYTDIDLTKGFSYLIKSGETTRSNTTGNCLNSNDGINTVTFNCSIDVFYYDAEGSWIINVTSEDLYGYTDFDNDSTVTINSLDDILLNDTAVNCGTGILPGAQDVACDVITIANRGNQNYASINETAHNLDDDTTGTILIDANVFTVSTTDTPAGTALSNGTSVTIPSSTLNKGDGANISWYTYIDVPTSRPVDTYSSTSDWILEAIQ